MIRYQIRNEYGLSDPELFAAPGEEDDPEALLEGVAMAGLVGVLRQLGDLAEFAAEIFHDLHEDVMATASRGHGLMLRLQQLEAEFPAVEKAIISQADHSNYPHDDGVDWHANLQLKQNMITQGDMPRFILDSYEECRGPPHLFTLDKFDVAGAGASLKRYSDPSFFKTEHAANMIETDVLIENKPRRIKKKATRWRKGATLKSLLIANSETHTTPKDRTSRKVPPRTTKLKNRHPQSPDHKTISRICREHLQEVISSQQKILSRYSVRQYHVNFRSTDSTEVASPLGEMDNFGALVQSSGKLELTKVVPVNESDTMEIKSANPDGSAYLDLGDKRILGKQHEPSEQNGMVHGTEKLHDCPNFQVEERNYRSHSACEENPPVAGVPADQKDVNGCRPDDIVSDQDSFIDALNIMGSEGEAVPEMETECDPGANVVLAELNRHSMEGENALYVESPEVGPAKDSSPGLNNSSNGGEPTCMDLTSSSDSALPTVSATNDPKSGSQSGRQLNVVEDEEPFNDVDLMDVSSSSSVVSDNTDVRTNDDPASCLQDQEEAYHSMSDDHAAVTHDSDKRSLKTSSDVDGMAIGSDDYTEKENHAVEHEQDIELDNTFIISSKPNDVSEDKNKINFGVADDLFLHHTKPNQKEIQESEKELEAGGSLESDTSPSKPASSPDKDVEMNNVKIPEEIVADTAPTGLDPDGHMHQDGIAPKHSSIHNNLLYESYDDDITEDMHSLLDDGLSDPFNKHVEEDPQVLVLEEGFCPTSLNTCKDGSMQAPVRSSLSTPFNKHVAEDHQIVVPEEETCPTSVNTCKDNSLQASALASDFNVAPKLPESIPGLLPSQEEIKTGTEPLEICVPLPNTSNSFVEQHELAETKEVEEDGKFVVAEESTTSGFADDMVPPEEFIDASIYTEKAEVLATESTEEGSRHDVQVQSSSPSREELETVETIPRNLGPVDESREHISELSVLQTHNIPPTEIETTGEKCSDRDDIHFLSLAQLPVDSDYQEELLEEASHNAEVLSLCDLNKDGAGSLESDTVEKQPVNVDQDLAWGMPAQDPCSTNPFMDPAYMMSHTLYTSPCMSGQPCFPEQQDFLSELLIQRDSMGGAADSLWEPATPPDEVPLPSEVMTEEDFRSFCHEYHEIDFSDGTEGFHSEPASDSNNMSNDFLVSESDFPCSNSALPMKLDQEACAHSMFCSQSAECSSAMDLKISSGKDLKDETPGADSQLKSHDFFSDNRSPELDVLSGPVDLEREQHGLSGVDSHNSSPLLDKEQTDEEYCFPLSNVVEVKQKLEICADLVPHSFINEKGDGLDLPVPVEPEIRACTSYGFDSQEVPCSTSEKNESLQGSEVYASDEFDCPVIPSSSGDENIDNLEASTSETSFRAQHESEYCTLGKHDSQTVPSPLPDENIDELDGPPLSNCNMLDRESEVCVRRGLDAKIAPCITDDNMHELDLLSLSSSVLVDRESEDHVPDEHDFQVTPCSLVKDKVDESEDAQPNHDLPEELDQEAHAPHELDFEAAPYSLNDDKVGEIEVPPSCNGWVESVTEPDCSTEVDSQTAACSSNSIVLTDTAALTSTPAMPSTEETYQSSPGMPPSVQPQNDSYEDPQAPPPLPPLLWRLGRPRLGFLSRKDCMPESARRIDPVFQASSQAVDTRLGLLDQTDRSIEPVSSQAIKEDKCQSSLACDNDQHVEFRRFSTRITVTDVARTEHCFPFSVASEEQRCISSSATGVEEHLDAGVTSATADGEHQDDSEMTVGIALYSLDPLFSLPAYQQQDPELRILSSDTRENSECPSQPHPAPSEDDQSTDAAGSMESTSRKEHVSENRCYQQPQHDEPSSETADHEEHITNASEGVKHQSDTSEAPSHIPKHSAPGTPLKEGNSQESQILQEQNVESSKDDQPGVSLRSLEPMAPQDYPHDECNLERENRHQASRLGPQVEWSDNKSKLASVLDEGSYTQAEQPPVMGWTVGPQMLHPKYGISVKESEYEPNITENHLIRKPISIKNIPRNPLVDAVAAHDRSSMRKISELAPSTDKPKPNERNLLLEQIRNKTFNLKPVAPAKATAMRSPARTTTRDLKVAAIIEKANAIRQAVGSDDEDADSWSDT
ncbi:hypothetical protein U9M48_010957 [Paspalum notatum var. saurae]|uniref:WH2 domain-containing protein n=1 Tax=Paspalum notatum var. saurae TaxID=547442 RepID=A0AAQ3WGV0_PASNO